MRHLLLPFTPRSIHFIDGLRVSFKSSRTSFLSSGHSRAERKPSETMKVDRGAEEALRSACNLVADALASSSRNK
jgi:hypothetical protein